MTSNREISRLIVDTLDEALLGVHDLPAQTRRKLEAIKAQAEECWGKPLTFREAWEGGFPISSFPNYDNASDRLWELDPRGYNATSERVTDPITALVNESVATAIDDQGAQELCI